MDKVYHFTGYSERAVQKDVINQLTRPYYKLPIIYIDGKNGGIKGYNKIVFANVSDDGIPKNYLFSMNKDNSFAFGYQVVPHDSISDKPTALTSLIVIIETASIAIVFRCDASTILYTSVGDGNYEGLLWNYIAEVKNIWKTLYIYINNIGKKAIQYKIMDLIKIIPVPSAARTPVSDHVDCLMNWAQTLYDHNIPATADLPAIDVSTINSLFFDHCYNTWDFPVEMVNTAPDTPDIFEILVMGIDVGFMEDFIKHASGSTSDLELGGIRYSVTGEHSIEHKIFIQCVSAVADPPASDIAYRSFANVDLCIILEKKEDLRDSTYNTSRKLFNKWLGGINRNREDIFLHLVCN
jgi:hypothetical protein